MSSVGKIRPRSPLAIAVVKDIERRASPVEATGNYCPHCQVKLDWKVTLSGHIYAAHGFRMKYYKERKGFDHIY